MKKSGRKVLSIIMAAVMVFALLPVFSMPMAVKAAPEKHTHNGTNDSAHEGWMAIATEEDYRKLINDGGSGYLANDITINKPYSVSGKVVNLCLNGHNIIQKADADCIKILRKGTLNLYDEVYNSGSITHDKNSKGLGIEIQNDGILNMYGGKISNNNSNDNGGGIDQNSGTVNMYGGVISNNTAHQGGGVNIDQDGIFNLYDGLISENKAYEGVGGGISLISGTLIMSGGEITKNSVTNTSGVTGGGVFVLNGEKFVMSGGKITNNYSNCKDTNSCGGIYAYSDLFEVTGGIVSGNYSENNQDGIHTNNMKSIKGGYIYDSINYYNERECYSVTFDANGGSGNMPTQYVPNNINMPIGKNQFTNSRKVFVEWNTEKDGSGTSYADEGKINIDKNTTLYAQWIDPNVNSYKVTFKVENGTWNDGTTGDKEIQVKRNKGEIKLLKVDSSLIPKVGNKPDVRYKAGKWDGSFKKVISENTTFTYTYELDPSVKQLEISFDENYESSNIIKENTGYDHKFTELPTPSLKEGYDFDGWYTEKTDGTKITAETVFDSETTVYAHWKAHNYTVVFNANGGSGNMANQNREYDSIEPLTENTFTKDGNTFMGWNTASDDSGDSYSDKAIANLTSEKDVEVILFAIWDPNAYKVKLNEGNGTINAGNITGYTYGVGATLPTASDMTLTGYTFDGWYDNVELTGTAITEISTTDLGDKELYAKWTPNPYTVVFDANGGIGTMLNMARLYDDGSALSENVYSFEAHSYTGWNTASDGTGTAYADKYVGDLSSTAGDVITLYAQWDDVVYTINATNDGNGTATVSADTGIKGTTITVTATHNDGYKFAGWEVVSGGVSLTDATSSSTTFTIGAENVVVKANFEEIIKEPQPGSEEPTEPTTPEEITNPKTPEEPTEPEVPEITEPEPNPEILEKDWLDDLRLSLGIATELGGPQTVTYSGDFALPYEIMQFLVDHPDITFIYNVTYEGVEYTITIPAGKAISYSEIEWYGPLWLLANYGAGNVPTGAKGNGTYLVKAGDTLTGISVKLGVTVQYLVEKNGIKNADVIVVGQLIEY